ncbi:MAG: DUF2807 domain-containing protein [Roseivirga sp.]|nr:DUF2807 domain-containing protein [Roseivirga sp.]
MKKQLSHYRSIWIAMIMMVTVVSMSWAQDREKRDVSGFDELSISSAFVVEISVGNTESLEIEADDRYMDDVITEVRGGKLVIKMRDGRGRRRMNSSPRAYLTVKSLNSIHASGAVKVESRDELKADRMEIVLSGASVLDLQLDVKELYLQASGACVINVEGTATEQTVKTNGATTYRAYDLESEIADIRVTGAGSARVSVSEKLDVRASGASSIRYKGRPSVNSDTSGASSVKRAN